MLLEKLFGIVVVACTLLAFLLPPNPELFSAGTVGSGSNPCDFNVRPADLCPGMGGFGPCLVGDYDCVDQEDTGPYSSCTDDAEQIDCGDFNGCANANRMTSQTNATGCVVYSPVGTAVPVR